MAPRSVIMYGDDRVIVAFYKSANCIGCTLLHFRVRSLNSVELDTRSECARVRRRDRSSPHTNTIIVTTQDHNFVSSLRSLFYSLVALAITDSTSLHNDFVVT